MTKIIRLTKESTENEIKMYFEKVRELRKTGNEFPVDLESVWPLVYPRKDHAVRELKENFIQDVDFQSLLNNGERKDGGQNKVDFHLSVSCMEYFIARKVRPVFEVYRKVFHQAVDEKELSPAEMFMKSAEMYLAQEKRLSVVENEVKQIKARTQTDPEFFTIMGFSSLKGKRLNLNHAKVFGKKASHACKKRGIVMGEMPDPRFGRVKTYPKEVLEEILEEIFS